MLLTLSITPSDLTLGFLNKALLSQDELLVTNQAIFLALTQCPLNRKAYIREADANKLGGNIHSSWKVIDDSQWLSLICQHDKTVTW